MAYPYVPSGGVIQKAIDQFKKALPPKVDAATLKKLGVAPSNEGYVINTLKFLGIISENNERTDTGVELFSTHGDDAFAAALEGILKDKYSALFDLRGDEAWALDRDALIAFFRGSDKSTAVVGARQAVTFITLAALANKRDAVSRIRQSPAARPKNGGTEKIRRSAEGDASPAITNHAIMNHQTSDAVALTVRVEINLPANASQATYDSIFKSIRSNLLNGNA